MLFRSDRLGIIARPRPRAIDQNFLEDAGAHAAGDDCNLIHAGPGVCDALLRPGRCAGPGIYPYGMVVSLLWNVPRMVGSCSNRQRHLFECAVRQPAENYFSATRY